MHLQICAVSSIMVAYFSGIPAIVSSSVSTIGSLCLNDKAPSLKNRGCYMMPPLSYEDAAGVIFNEELTLWLIHISNNT